MEGRTNKPGNRTTHGKDLLKKRTVQATARTTAMAHTPQDARKVRGRLREEALFPVAPMRSDLPEDYAAALAEIKDRVRQERLRVVLAANSAMVLLYWDIGRVILDRQAREGWGARVIDRLAEDLQTAFPEMRGLSPRNLKYMRAFAGAWPDAQIVQRTVAQLPWRQNIIGVAEWETKIVASLPADLKGSLPTVEEIEAELSDESLSSSDKGTA